jgi:hypothetical protein
LITESKASSHESRTLHLLNKTGESVYEPKDHKGKEIIAGAKVRMVTAPDELTSGLPASDQSAIQAVVGKELRVEGFDTYGHVELMFRDKYDIIHCIWIRPIFLELLP